MLVSAAIRGVWIFLDGASLTEVMDDDSDETQVQVIIAAFPD